MEYLLGTRGSALALAQTEWVGEKLQKAFPQHTFSVKIIVTKGDKILDRPLDKVGGKGIFVKEIEQQLLQKSIHIGVHSLKDMPTAPPNGLCYTKFWQREDCLDCLVLNGSVTNCNPKNPLDLLPIGATVGTGSKRRIAQLKHHRPDLKFVPIRGNINTRLQKMTEQNLNGVVLAAAGLKRLGMKDRICGIFPPDILTPAPGQGTLALEILEENNHLRQMLDSLADQDSHLCASAERTFLEQVDGGCHLPVGAFCTIQNQTVQMTAFLGNETQTFCEWKNAAAPMHCANELAKELAEQLLKQREEL